MDVGPGAARNSPQSLTFVSYVSPSLKQSVTAKRKTRRTQRIEVGSKVRNACIQCREKKTRCSGHQPCVRCEQHGQSCQYMPTVSTQKLNSKWASKDSLVSPASPVTSHSRATFFSEEPDIEGFQQSPHRSTTETNKPDESLQEDQNGHVHGGASEFAFMQLAKQRLASLPSVSIDFSDHPLPDSRNFPPIMPPKTIADHLISTYFGFGLSTSRFVHEPSFITTVDKMYNGQELELDEVALAYMILALGSHYSKQKNQFCGYTASVRFYKMSDAALKETPDLVTLASSQTRLLIIHYLLNHARMHEAWSVFGLVVRHIQALGLHRRSRSINGNHIKHEYRKRLFWCVYIIDRILSSMFGRPLAIHDDDIDQEECALANDEDIEESRCQVAEDGVFCSAAGLIHYARLARILGQILREFYTPSARQHDISRHYSSSSRFERALAEWQNQLPLFLNYVTLPPSAVSITAQRQMCTLKLMFAHASLLLYRPFILHAIGSAEQSSTRDQWVKRCHEKSIEAANTVVSECRYLSQRGLFSRVFWLVNYMQFASIGTLLVYSYLWPEDGTARKTAQEAMDQFPIGIDGDLVGQRYLETLKELHQITAEAQNGLSPSRPMLDAPTESGIGSINNDCIDEGSWANFFFDPSLIDDLTG